jgi:hypothetical protein
VLFGVTADIDTFLPVGGALAGARLVGETEVVAGASAGSSCGSGVACYHEPGHLSRAVVVTMIVPRSAGGRVVV